MHVEMGKTPTQKAETAMPTKRRPLKHAPRIGEIRVTERLLNLYRAFQTEVREHRDSVRVADLLHELHCVLRHLPWESVRAQHADYRELHLLAYPDPATRPPCLDVIGRRDDLDGHERRHHRVV